MAPTPNIHNRTLTYQITNVTSTALAMAAFDQTVVSLPYLTDAMKLNQDFQADFKGAGYLDGQRSYI